MKHFLVSSVLLCLTYINMDHMQVNANLLSSASKREKRDTNSVLPAWLDNIVRNSGKRSKEEVLVFMKNIGIQFIMERNAKSNTKTSAQFPKGKSPIMEKTRGHSLSDLRKSTPVMLKTSTEKAEKSSVQLVSTEMPMLTVTEKATRQKSTPFPELQTTQPKTSLVENVQRAKETKQRQIVETNTIESTVDKDVSNTLVSNAENKVNLNSTDIPMVQSIPAILNLQTTDIPEVHSTPAVLNLQTTVPSVVDIAGDRRNIKKFSTPTKMSIANSEKTQPTDLGRKIKSIFSR